MSDPTAQMQQVLAGAISDFGHGSARTLQSKEGRIGPSDLGWCRMKATLMTRGVPQSDVKPINSAQIGTAIHAYVAEAFGAVKNDDWHIEVPVTATFPNGAEISGTADLIMSDWNACIDVKTVDGFEWVKREGTSQNHKFQRHTYTLGGIAAGLLDDSKPLYVGNLYIDRSGKEKEPLLLIEEFDPSLTDQISSWIDDVIYAAKNGEDASRDIPAPVCAQICEHFTTCRGNLPIEEGGESISDEMRISAIKMFDDGRELAKRGEQMKKEAGAILVDTNGIAVIDGITWQVRNVWVNPTRVDAFEKRGYNRLDVKSLKPKTP
jgi:hypothetical protein